MKELSYHNVIRSVRRKIEDTTNTTAPLEDTIVRSVDEVINEECAILKGDCRLLNESKDGPRGGTVRG